MLRGISAFTMLAGAASALALAAPAQAQQGCTLAITNVTLIDGNGGPARANATVRISGDRIQRIAGVDGGAGCADTIDGTGKFLMPGMIDTNVHVAMVRAYEVARYWDRLDQVAIEGAQLSLKQGVTSIRDSYSMLAPVIKARDAIRRGDAIGARLMVAGNIVGWGGSYSETFRGSKPNDFLEEWINEQYTRGSGELLPWMSVADLRKAINAYMDLGVDFVKIGVTDHDHNSSRIIFSQRQLNALVEEIHKRGKIAETHATSPEGMVMAINAGIDLIQHPEVIGVPITDEALGLLDQGKVLCSIHGNNHVGAEFEDALKKAGRKQGDWGIDAPAPPPSDKPKPRTTLRNWADPAKTESDRLKQMRDANPFVLRGNAEKILKTRCPLTTATDNSMGGAPEFQREPSRFTVREMGTGTIASVESLVEMGRTPSDAIVAATKNGARAMGMLKELGTIEPGKYADMVLLDANPLDKIANIRKIAVIVKDGKRVDRDKLPEKPVFYRAQNAQ